jgi:hypothetical protein
MIQEPGYSAILNLKRPLTEEEESYIDHGEPIKIPTYRNKPEDASRICLWCGVVFYRGDTFRDLEDHVDNTHTHIVGR